MNYPVIILGAGGHAKVLIDALRLQSIELLGVTDTDYRKIGQLLLGVPVISGDEEITKYSPQNVRLVNGLGSVRVNSQRRFLFESFKRKGYQFVSVVHPSAIIGADCVLSEGVQIMAGAIIQAGCHIGINTVINTGSIVDHDCCIGNHAHISPGTTLSGGVCIGDDAHIGTGAKVIQGVKIGNNSLVAAGAVVIYDVEDNATVAGVPASNRITGKMNTLSKNIAPLTTTIKEAIFLLEENTKQIILIVDNRNRLVGTVTDGDVRRGMLKGLSMNDSVHEIMNSNPIVATIDESRESVLATMRSKGLRHIPLIDESHRVIGLEVLNET